MIHNVASDAHDSIRRPPGIASELEATYFNPTYKDVVAFGVLIAVLLIRPQGIFAEVAVQKEVAV